MQGHRDIPLRPAGNVTMLLPSSALFLVGMFRLFDCFRRDYDQSCLDAALGIVRARLGAAASDGVMSDALLLDNELRVRTAGHLAFMPVGSAAASPDERSIVHLIAALQARSYRHAAECALDLDILQSRTMLMLAERLAERLSQAGVVLPFWTGRADQETQAHGPVSPLRLV